MSAFYDLASLVLVPSGTKAQKIYAQKPLTTDGQLAFTRSTTATRVNSAGLIEASAINVPRLDYLNSTCPKLLLEPSRTSLYTYSSEIENAAWGKTNTTVTANSTTSPDGTANADKVVANTTNGVHRIEQDRATAAQVATQSVFAKASGYNFIALENGGELAYFNISTGVVGSVSAGTASIQNYGNGWYRCIFTATAGNTKSYVYIANANNSASFAGDNTSGAFIYGAQFEAGAYATSYIPTTTAAVTRGEDACSKTGISSLIGQQEGVVFVDFVYDGSAAQAGNLFNMNNSTTASVFVTRTSGGLTDCGVFENGTVKGHIVGVGSITIGTRIKLAYAYKSGSSALYINGTQIGTSSTTFTIPAALTEIKLNDTLAYFAFQQSVSFNQHLLFTTRLTNAQLAELTTI